MSLKMALVLSVVALSGCFMMGYSTVEQVTLAARDYNNDVRWWRLEQASAYVPVKERQRFIARRSELEDELEIADFEMVNLEVDKKKETAVARVDYSWMLKKEGRLVKTTTQQQWERQDGKWVVASETRVKGAPLAIFDEPTKGDK